MEMDSGTFLLLATLERWQAQIARYFEGRRLMLHPRKTFIAATAEPAQFLGYVLHRGGMRTLPAQNVQRFRGRLQSMRALEERRTR